MFDLNFKVNVANLENLSKTIQRNCKRRVVCGIPDDEEYPDGTKVAEVALINEFGLLTGMVEHPPRPFMSETLRSNELKYRRMMGGIVPSMAFGNVGDNDFREVGREMVQDMKLSIDNWSPCDPRMNKKSTISAKNEKNGNGQVALIDTGKMKDSIAWWVENG